MTAIPVLPKVSTHKGYILSQLLKGERRSNKELFYNIHTCASGCRISELRADGWKIVDYYKSSITKEHKKVKEKIYFIRLSDMIDYKRDRSLLEFIRRCNLQYPTSA